MSAIDIEARLRTSLVELTRATPIANPLGPPRGAGRSPGATPEASAEIRLDQTPFPSHRGRVRMLVGTAFVALAVAGLGFALTYGPKSGETANLRPAFGGDTTTSVATSTSSTPCPAEYATDGAVTNTIPCPSVRVTIPDLAGMSTPSAAGELSGLGLSVNVVNVSSTSIPPGQVVAVLPVAGAVVAARSTVTLENSLGPNN
jgi:hypothetical protein